MNHVLEGFYKQAEEMGMSREATTSFLETIEKTAAALNEYVTEAAIASGDPVGFMQKFADELQDPELLAQQQAEASGMQNRDFTPEQLAQQQTQANGMPNAQVNPGMLENFIKDHPTIGPYIQKLMSGGKDGAMMGGMGGGVLGLITALMTGQNPLMGLLAGGGIGALGGGAFGDKLQHLGASDPADIAKAQAGNLANIQKQESQAGNLADVQKRDATNMAAHDDSIAKQEAAFAAEREAKSQAAQATNLADIQKRDSGNMAAQDADIAKQEAGFAAERAAKEQAAHQAAAPSRNLMSDGAVNNLNPGALQSHLPPDTTHGNIANVMKDPKITPGTQNIPAGNLPQGNSVAPTYNSFNANAANEYNAGMKADARHNTLAAKVQANKDNERLNTTNVFQGMRNGAPAADTRIGSVATGLAGGAKAIGQNVANAGTFLKDGFAAAGQGAMEGLKSPTNGVASSIAQKGVEGANALAGAGGAVIGAGLDYLGGKPADPYKPTYAPPRAAPRFVTPPKL